MVEEEKKIEHIEVVPYTLVLGLLESMKQRLTDNRLLVEIPKEAEEDKKE